MKKEQREKKKHKRMVVLCLSNDVAHVLLYFLQGDF